MRKNKLVKQPTLKQRNTLRLMIVLGMISLLNFFYWFFSPQFTGNSFLYGLLIIVIIYVSARLVYEWYHYWSISIPEDKPKTIPLSVDFLTTYFPGEPYEMIENTLLAIKNVRYPHTTILCDEANDERLIEFCRRHGIKHISRDNRVDAKAGNINNALRNIATGEICVILDPDHVPQPDFLDDIIPYFQDPEIGYVQIVQAYNNFDESYVAKGAAQQTFQFYGPMMMCMNSYGTVNAIGANCTFRRAALDSIGGHAPGLAEDMHTSMLLHAKGWKSIYVPKVLARGLVPSSLTAYYKQQLKWSRGTLELLVSVYPKIFKTLSNRQRLHYATIPLHYLVGFIYFFNFLIPIISLITATSPWKGNILFFGLITIPLITSLLVIRSFVQRWVMEESERGFHMIGGLLLISTWWVFCVGAIYTVLRKKVPYLPTPKTGEDKTSWKLMIPNAVIALVSLFAIIYGLSKDFTPFSIFMSGFAGLNIGFMLFSFYLASHKYVEIESIGNTFKKGYYQGKFWIKQLFWDFRHGLYRNIRQAALPLVIISFLISFSLIFYDQYMKWEGVQSYPELPVLPNKLLGIYAPNNVNGLSDPERTEQAESALSTKFDLVAHYIPWGDTRPNHDISTLLASEQARTHTPFITWEPWGSTFDFSKDHDDLQEEREIFKYITNGYFDNYLSEVASQIKAYNGRVYLRFAHEFDNPQYPWSRSGGNTPDQFKTAWSYVHTFFKKQGVNNVKWIWSPWKPNSISEYYPGDTYVDLIGVTALHYGKINETGIPYSFDQLYLPIKDSLHAAGIRKPVILSEFGSLNLENGQINWINEALDSIYFNHTEITGMVFFNSDIDKNIPIDNTSLSTLDWTLTETNNIRYKLWELEKEYTEANKKEITPTPIKTDRLFSERNKLPDTIRGISYKKGQNWYKNYQVMDIQTVLKDFEHMKMLGLNTVKYFGSSVYDRNMLKAADAKAMHIIYGLWLPESLNSNTAKVENIEDDILQAVARLKDKKEIIAWNLGNDIISKIYQYNKPDQAAIKITEHLKWLQKLIGNIKALDAERPVIIDLELNSYAYKNAELLINQLAQLDMLSISVKSNTFDEEFFKLAQLKGIPYMIGDIKPSELTRFNQIPSRFLFRNWQDQHESNLVSFDGIIDHKGRKKNNYFMAKEIMQGSLINAKKSQRVSILRPAMRLTPDKEYQYYALLRNQETEQWKYAIPNERNQLEWYLVKCDRFGTPLAFKSLGTGIDKSIQIPESYENYVLVLKFISEGVVHTAQSSLNIPLENTEPALVALYGS
ncbi:glycosyltransferase [Robertkochia marina]|uniref:Glycosyltransferase n=1 Tax=Robertkochia marina TaxID=1227945 RepID=A0A4S3M6U8_9FLAO|nr:glycosyltransferase [Robertkochia marina]THD69967.1 glycosyltransferase [Robertkochia marina]TRZ46688.1 glycosyltransferase [Robertkochia marina]